MRKKILLSLIFVIAANIAMAQTQYVFMRNNNSTYCYVDNNAWNYTSSTFSPSYIWTVTNGVPYNNGRYLIISRSGNTYTYSSSLSSTSSTTYTFNLDDNTIVSTYQRSSRNRSSTYYLPYIGGNLATNTSTNNRVIAYEVDTHNIETSSTAPTISGSSILTEATTYNYTASGASYQMGYTNYYFNSTDHYFDGNTAITPTAANVEYTWSLTDNSYATVNASSGVITVSSLPESDITLTLTVTATFSGGTPAVPANTTLTNTKEVTLLGTKPTAPTITVNGATVTLNSDAPNYTSIRYTLDGSDPTATTGTVYSGEIDLSGSTSSPVTIKAVTVRNGHASDISSREVTLTLPAPVIVTDAEAGTASITCSINGASIYYTTDGSTPSSTNGNLYSGTISNLSLMTSVNAIAIKSGWDDSPVATATITIPSGISGGVVTLMDFENHTWSYYQATLPDGTANPICSPAPRNVTIEYRGNGGEVSLSEDDTAFVYYKTIEKIDGSYSYEVIPNPFSKRPKNGSTYQGFNGWEVVSVTGGTISGYTTGQVIPAETKMTLNITSSYTTNCTSMKIVLKATWATAYVRTYNGYQFNNVQGNSAKSTYDLNFVVVTGNADLEDLDNLGYPATITMVYPDGTNDGRNSYSLSGAYAGTEDTKFEYIRLYENVTEEYDWWNRTYNYDYSTTFIANASGEYNNNLILGRGIIKEGSGSHCAYSVSGIGGSTTNSLNYKLRIESGHYMNISFIAGGIQDQSISYTFSASSNHVVGILGCDYDRAKNDTTSLTVTDQVYVGGRNNGYGFTNQNIDEKVIDIFVKSGDINSSASVGDASASDGMYCSFTNYMLGKRHLEIEGGRMCNIAGGIDQEGMSDNDTTFTLRMRGGHVRGSIYGGGAFAATYGCRKFILTGGTVDGWLACGANGVGAGNQTGEDYGRLQANTFLYVGGTTKIGNSDATNINTIAGGNVFGAGNGGTYNSGRPNSGEVKNATVEIADDCFIYRDVYGGGNQGHTKETGTIYILGGTVHGGVYGGSNQNDGTSVNIHMFDGIVESGIYGGSNTTGTISSNVTMQINGGQVGTSSSEANIHGGGYGQSTRVSGNIDITLGEVGQAEDGVVVYGDVYGGSALGYVNGTSASTTLHTNVTLNKGTINGSLFGGALGSNSVAANVYAPVTITVTDGLVSSGVYGGCNTNGTVYGTTAVTISGGTIGAADANANIYGGGFGSNTLVTKGATVLFGNTCNDYTTPIVYGDVYGGSAKGYVGGTAANDTYTTTVTIQGGTVTGDVYGGGHGDASYAADVRGPVVVNITGGKMTNVFGCNNANGAPLRTAVVNINIPSSCNSANCESDAADYNITGSIYGGGNAAAYSGTTQVTFTSGVAGDIFGGGLGAAASVAETNVLMSGGSAYRVFGGGNAAPVTGDTHVIIRGLTLICNNVYGGGNAAVVGGNTHVSIGE